MKRPIFIRHRVNKIRDLRGVPRACGVEIDIRSARGHLVLSHDPYLGGESLEKYLQVLRKRRIKGPIVLNTKEDGLEPDILKLMKKNRLRNYFFLDTAMPTLIRMTQKNRLKEFAFRVSEHESRASAMHFKNRTRWIWLDCFTGRPPSVPLVKSLTPHFRVCLVSPELQHYPLSRIASFKKLARHVDAICTKQPHLWK